MQAVDESLQTLNRLLCGERAAVETYTQALEKVGQERGGATLRDICREHQHAAELLTEHVLRFGGEPETSSGAWGAFASAVMGTAKLFGNHAAWEALSQGEDHGVDDYESALKEEHLADECRTLITTKLLPAQRRHISLLESIENADKKC
jgi:uncharacterized protein (TIGR02284 family)